MCLWLWSGAVPVIVSLHPQTPLPPSTHTHTRTHTHPHWGSHSSTHIHTHPHMYPHTQYACAHTHTHTHTHTCTHVCTRPHIRIHIHNRHRGGRGGTVQFVQVAIYMSQIQRLNIAASRGSRGHAHGNFGKPRVWRNRGAYPGVRLMRVSRV